MVASPSLLLPARVALRGEAGRVQGTLLGPAVGTCFGDTLDEPWMRA